MHDLFNLQGRVALVTGASRGLGQAMALGLAQAGASVAVVGRTPVPDLLDRIAAQGVRGGFYEHDLGDIDVIVPVEKYQGGFRTVAEGVNNMVGGHIAVKKKAMACVLFASSTRSMPGRIVGISANPRTHLCGNATFRSSCVWSSVDIRSTSRPTARCISS